MWSFVKGEAGYEEKKRGFLLTNACLECMNSLVVRSHLTHGVYYKTVTCICILHAFLLKTYLYLMLVGVAAKEGF